MHNNADIPEI